MNTIKIKPLEGGKMPIKASEQASGYDCFVRSINHNPALNQVEFGLGFQMEFNDNLLVTIVPRSSLTKLKGCYVPNSMGVIDPDYRGELMIKIAYFDEQGYLDLINAYPVGSRVCQMVVAQAPKFNLLQVDELTETQRGEGGFGSTDNKEARPVLSVKPEFIDELVQLFISSDSKNGKTDLSIYEKLRLLKTSTIIKYCFDNKWAVYGGVGFVYHLLKKDGIEVCLYKEENDKMKYFALLQIAAAEKINDEKELLDHLLELQQKSK